MVKPKCLSDDDIQEFISQIDRNGDGVIDYEEVEQRLDEVHDVIAPEPKTFRLHHEYREKEARHAFLRSVIKTKKQKIPVSEFAATVKSWNVPALEQDQIIEKNHRQYMKSMPISRRMRAFWAVDGPEILFLTLVVSLQVAFGTWQLVYYSTSGGYLAAYGPGVVIAKTCAGILYPTLFFMILSMSRYLATYTRKFYYFARIINWDLSQAFHIKMACCALFFASLHGLAHLSGCFIFASRPENRGAVAAVNPHDVLPSYDDYLRSLPGWTGLVALGMFWTIALLGMPLIRKWKYEVFQLGHLLMFPMIALLMAHGTSKLLHYPMLGFWLAIPTLIVIIERFTRFALGFHRTPAELKILDDDTISITIPLPERIRIPLKAGQYVLLQVPQVSLFEWHPFTISTCTGGKLAVHIRTDGNWTGKVRQLGSSLKYVSVDGPFGAPAQRFYEFDQSIIIGSGIGVTPFSGILTDLQLNGNRSWRSDRRRSRTEQTAGSSSASSITATPETDTPESSNTLTPNKSVCENDHSNTPKGRDLSLPYHRVDFHWIVKDKNQLLWFSNLLNAVSSSSTEHTTSRRLTRSSTGSLEIRIETHVSQKRRNISAHIFRYLLETHRTPENPLSPLTGLYNTTKFGRPDLGTIMEDHYEDMKLYVAEKRKWKEAGGEGAVIQEKEKTRKSESMPGPGPEKGKFRETKEKRRLRVGVFFCGTPAIGRELADRCERLTLRGREDGTLIEYHFKTEVFG